jgi:5-methylcytosine-specific restriction protein A
MPQRGIETARRQFTSRQKERLWLAQAGRCADCGVAIPAHWSRGGPHNRRGFHIYPGEIHHVTPVISGGAHTPDNWVMLCHSCHQERHAALRGDGDA